MAWALFLITSLTYNYFTFFYFLAIQGFPMGVWFFIEIMVELYMIFEFCTNLYLLKKDKSIWKKMYILRDKNDQKTVKIALNMIASLPSSLIIYLIH